MASNRHAAPSDPRAAVAMSQETDMRIQHNPKPLLPVHVGVHWGGGGVTQGVRTNEGVHKREICMSSRQFVRLSNEILANSRLCIGYSLGGFWHFSIWAPFGHGGCVWGETFTG